jgi:hypothetical protein
VPPLANGQPGPIPADKQNDPVFVDGYKAARYIAELNFYRQVSNFMHHYNRCFVEQNPETVACRKAFYVAEKLYVSADPPGAFRTYQEPTANPAWGGSKLSPLVAWRDLVLKKNKDFRRDSMVEEATAEIQFRYLWLENQIKGREHKQQLTQAASVIPLMPPLNPDFVPLPVTTGPFDAVDEEGRPYVTESTLDSVAQRMNLPGRRKLVHPETPPPTRAEVEKK